MVSPTGTFRLVHHLSCGLSILASWLSNRKTLASRPTHLLIEAGVAGWKEPAPGLLEIEQSAKEYLGEEAVSRLVVPQKKGTYIFSVMNRVREVQPTHYFYDTRTGSQNPIWGALQAIILSVVFAWYDCTVLTIITNFPARRWRRQVAAISARSGLVLVLIHAVEAKRWLPHDRVLGPIFMPFSTLRLREIRDGIPLRSEGSVPSVTFIGTVYEPRTSELDRIGSQLEAMGIKFRRYERSPLQPKIDQENYWRILRGSSVVLTTADHREKKGADRGFPPHMVYRYTEALVAEACLVAPDLGGPLVPWEHFVPLGTTKVLRQTFSALFADKIQAQRIAQNGSAFIAHRIEGHFWWREVDQALGAHRQPKLGGDAPI